jgi:hypothetical protein
MGCEPQVRDETLTLNGLRLHYRDWGDPAAPPVVPLHAYLQHARTWDTVARDLADRFRVLVLDQRGFGESAWAADYHELRLVADLGASPTHCDWSASRPSASPSGRLRQLATRRSTPTALNVSCSWSASPQVRKRGTSYGSRPCGPTSPGCARCRRRWPDPRRRLQHSGRWPRMPTRRSCAAGCGTG